MKKSIDLLHEPILGALTKLALPIMATSLVQMAYNLTDMAWIGFIGADAVAAVGSAGMYVWLSQGVIALAKMGGQVKVAHALGGGKEHEAAKYAGGALQMGVLLAILYGMITLFGAKPLIGFFKLNDAGIDRDAILYLQITCSLSIFPFLNSILTGIQTATGDSRTPFKANVIGLIINIVLDPLLIFGLGPIPAMGVAGAALATVLAQVVVTLAFIHTIRKDTIIYDKVNILKPTPSYYFRMIVKVGFPSAIQNLLYTGFSMVLTRLVSGWGAVAISVQKVGGQVESISWMTADGFAAAINSFTGQNYGGGQYKRVKKGYMTAVGMMFVWGIITTAVLVCWPAPIFRLFIREPEILPHGIDYLRIVGYSQMFMCIEITTVGALAGLGKTKLSSVISILLTSSRIPLAIILSGTALGLSGIWWALTISSIVKGFVFFFTYLHTLKGLPKERGVVS